jgi:hypothetical protein
VIDRAKPHTVVKLAEIERGPDSKIMIAVNEGEGGARYLALRRLSRSPGGSWFISNSFNIPPREVLKIADVIRGSLVLLAERTGAGQGEESP